MFSALFDLLTGNFLFFALHFDSRSVFPKPLSAKEERECFERMAQGDKAAKDKLIEHNLRLVAHIIKKYYSNSTDQEDLISIGTIGLIKAVSTFDHKKGCRFATYGSRCVENEILMHFRSQKKSANDIHFDEPVDSDKDGNQLCLIDIIADGEDVADKIELSIRSEQLYRYIRGEIEAGRLAAGERLPSKRALASHLKISVVTVEGAYGQLLAEGYLRSEPKRGFFVQAVQEEHRSPAPARTLSVPAPPTPALPYDFSTSAVDTALFPFATWAKLMREVLSEQAAPLLASPHPQGLPALRRAIAEHLYRFRGIRADAEQIVVGAGSETLIGLLVQLLGREGGYGVENPGYTKTQRILTSCGAAVRPLPLDGQGLRVDALEEAGVRVVHVTPSHHYPLGIIMPVARRQALLRWAEAAPDRYILEDDYDSEFRFSGRPIPALQSLDGGERVVYLNTFAKSLAPSLRISYMVLPPHLLERWRRDFWFYSSTVPSFEQYTLAQFLEGGHFERHIARMRVEYRDRKAALAAGVRDLGIPGTLSGGDAGLHMLLRMDSRLGEAELVRRAAEAGVAVYPLSSCRLTPAPEGEPPTLIMGYARLEAGDIRRALLRLREAWG